MEETTTDDEDTLAKKRKSVDEAPFLIDQRMPESNAERQICDLPNSVMQHILSFCLLKDAIKVCGLSRQWKSLWTSVPNLLFYCDRGQDVRAFAAFVDNALMLYSAPKVQAFRLDFPFDNGYEERVVSWLSFAVNHEVEQLFLNFSGVYKGILESWCWTCMSLKMVILVNVRLGTEIVPSIFRGSPLIECLVLSLCELSESLDNSFVFDATNTSLKDLVIDGCTIGNGQKGSIKIIGPNLQFLTMVGNVRSTELILVDVSSLVLGNVGFCMDRLCTKEKKMIVGILEKMHHVDRLIVGSWILQVLSILRLGGEVLPTLQCKSLRINMRMTKMHLPLMEVLLHTCPSLEQLTLDLVARKTPNLYRKSRAVKENYWRSETRIFECLNQHLKKVEILGFDASNLRWKFGRNLVEMAQFLLENAKVLQKLIIHTQGNYLNAPPHAVKRQKNLLEIKEKLLQYPSVSPDAVIVFESGRE